MIYILSAENKITGINLNTYNFFQFDVNKIIERISERTNTIHTDLNGEIYEYYYKILPNFPQLKRYIVTLLTK
jgi:hypothetical protein